MSSKELVIYEKFENNVKNKKRYLFNLKPPSDLISGINIGINNIFIGLGIGFVSFIATPILFTKKSGVTGLIPGISIGFLFGIIFVILGFLKALSSMILGIYNTPNAINSKIKGKIWDKYENKWIYYSLREEEQKTELLIRDANNNTGLYKVLNIDKDATQNEIKRAYHKLSLEYHPDRNSSKENYNDKKFKEINEAYKILSCPVSREKYDKFGMNFESLLVTC